MIGVAEEASARGSRNCARTGRVRPDATVLHAALADVEAASAAERREVVATAKRPQVAAARSRSPPPAGVEEAPRPFTLELGAATRGSRRWRARDRCPPKASPTRRPKKCRRSRDALRRATRGAGGGCSSKRSPLLRRQPNPSRRLPPNRKRSRRRRHGFDVTLPHPGRRGGAAPRHARRRIRSAPPRCPRALGDDDPGKPHAVRHQSHGRPRLVAQTATALEQCLLGLQQTAPPTPDASLPVVAAPSKAVRPRQRVKSRAAFTARRLRTKRARSRIARRLAGAHGAGATAARTPKPWPRATPHARKTLAQPAGRPRTRGPPMTPQQRPPLPTPSRRRYRLQPQRCGCRPHSTSPQARPCRKRALPPCRIGRPCRYLLRSSRPRVVAPTASRRPLYSRSSAASAAPVVASSTSRLHCASDHPLPSDRRSPLRPRSSLP